MNWQQFIDNEVGDKMSFTAKEVRLMLWHALCFVTDCWIHHTR